MRAPCVRCGNSLALDIPRVSMQFSPEELAQLARDTLDVNVRDRALCALGMVDQVLERHTRAILTSAVPGCSSCTELLAEISKLEKERADMVEDLDQLQATLEDRR